MSETFRVVVVRAKDDPNTTIEGYRAILRGLEKSKAYPVKVQGEPFMKSREETAGDWGFDQGQYPVPADAPVTVFDIQAVKTEENASV